MKKMLALAVDGITSLSIKPIRFIVFLGFMIFMCSILMLIYSLVPVSYTHLTLPTT